MTSTEQQTSPETRRRWTVDRKLSLWQLLVGALGLIIALYFGWRQIQPDQPEPPGPASTTAAADPPATTGPPVSPAAATTGPPVSTGAIFLDSLTPETGAGLLDEVPRKLQDTPGLTHPLVIECPTNSTDDLKREVSYALSRRYLQLDAEVRPYWTVEADKQSVTYAVVTVGTRERDGTITTRETGAQRSATADRPLPLTADLEDGDLLTIRIECQDPTGGVILSEARLTPA